MTDMIFKDIKMVKMEHRRYIFPAGQGGFHFEMIGDKTIVYDCGSLSSLSNVETCIDYLCTRTDHVNYLFISHFDMDHVNSLKYLLNSVKVNTAVTAMIPKDFRAVYNMATNGAYYVIRGLLTDANVDIEEVEGGENSHNDYGYNDIWEWIAKSMMGANDFTLLRTELSNEGINLNKLNDVEYVEGQRTKINSAFKTVFGQQGPNTKGLIMLSQHCKNSGTWQSEIYRGCDHWECYPYRIIDNSVNSSCLYVGDSKLKKNAGLPIVQGFLKGRMSDLQLELMQIPHHGSQYNSEKQLDQDILADYFFVNDMDTRRLQKNDALFRSLMAKRKLLVARDHCRDLIVTISWMHKP